MTSFRQAFIFILSAELFLVLLGFTNYGFSTEAWQAATRFSGRFSLGIFSLLFLFHNSHRFKIANVLSDEYFLIFAIAHGIHLLEVLSYLYLSGITIVPIRLAGGFLAYAFIFIMPIIYRYSQKEKIRPTQYRNITIIYMYYVWFIFFMTYLPRVRGTVSHVGGSYSEFVILLSWVSLLLGFKLQQLISIRKN